jgi:hypothetical protein
LVAELFDAGAIYENATADVQTNIFQLTYLACSRSAKTAAKRSVFRAIS